MGTPLVSVVIPVYNAAPYLWECLDSIAAQTLNNIEVICVDDGSTDDSPDLLERYVRKDSRFRVLRQKNAGGGAARNFGMSHASGEYLSFLDADDFFHPDLLRLSYLRATETDAEVVVYRARQHCQDTGRNIPLPGGYCREHLPNKEVFAATDMPKHLFNSFQNWPWNKLFSKAFIQEKGITFQELRRTNDMRFVCVALAEARRIALLDRVLVYYRTNTKTSCQDTNHEAPLDFLEAFIGTCDELEQRDKFPLLKQSFSNWVLDGIITNLRSIKGQECLKEVYWIIRERGIPTLRLMEHSGDYYYSQINYEILRKIAASETPPQELFRTGKIEKAVDYWHKYGLYRFGKKLYGRWLERLRP